MSKYYLLDMHVPDIEEARIVDVLEASPGSPEIRIDGLTPIRVPDGVRVINPTSLTDILDQKRAGVHALYPGFANIVWDDLLDASGMEPQLTDIGHSKIGSRGTIGGDVQTLDIDVSGTGIVTQCVVVYEIYSWRYRDSRDGRFERYYVEESDSGVVTISANGGVSTVTVSEGAITTFSPPQQGSLLQLQFSLAASGSLTANRTVLQVGYWAVLY